MKNLFILTVLFGLLMPIQAKAQQNYDQFQIQVDGLGCPFCAYGLEKKFREFKGIRNVAIDIETGNFTFAFPAEKGLSMEAVNQQVEKAGYTPMSTKIVRANGAVVSSENQAQNQINTNNLIQKTIRVAGNCEMCQARIHGAVRKLGGVAIAEWDIASKALLVDFDSDQISLEQIEKRIAEVGHDTPNFKANKATYDALPACCHYPRNSK